MMKKLFSMMALAALVASCSTDATDAIVAEGNETQVSFTVALEQSAGTRAISDGLTVNTLYWEVYDKNGNEVETLKGNKADAFDGAGKATVSFKLAKGQTYTFAFWAQNSSAAYKADDLTRVELDYAGKEADGNAEIRDAFFAYTEPITVSGDFAHDVEMKRPFAQLNLGVSDLEAFKAAGIELDQVEVHVTNLANNFDVRTGAVSGATDVTFKLADVLCNATGAEELALKTPIAINGTNVSNFPWLSMNYMLVNDPSTDGASSATSDVTFTITTSHDDVVLTSTSTPLQRNYRTNIIAKLTNLGTFNISIDKNFINDNDIVLEDVIEAETSAEELVEILSKGGTVVVNGVDEDTEAIDLTGLTLAQPLNLILNTEVESLKVGGAAGDVTVEVSNDVAYPAITFDGVVGNFTLKGNPESDATLDTQLNLTAAAGVNNITFDGVNFSYEATKMNQYPVQNTTNIETLTFVNCVAEDMAQRFISLNGGAKKVVIKDCYIQSRTDKQPFGHDSQRPIEIQSVEEVIIEGNTIINSLNKNGMWINKCDKVTVKNNTIANVTTDGIKVDNSTNVTITGNNIVEAKRHGINLYYAATTTDVVVTIEDNTISTMNAEVNSKPTYAISVNMDSATATVSGAFQIKNNKVGAAGIAGKYFAINAATATGDYNTPFAIAEGVAINAEGNIAISTAEGMYWFADQVNVAGKYFDDQTIQLVADIDLENKLWEPIGQTGQAYFKGVFDGNNKTIKNLNIDETSENSTYGASGLFGWFELSNPMIKDLTIDGATVKGHHWVGVICGYLYGSVENCTVKNATVSSTFNTVAKDDGDKAGAIVGLCASDGGKVVNCHAEDCQIDAIRDAGQLAGAGKVADVTGTATNVIVSHNTSAAGYGVAKDGTNIGVGELVGSKL